MLWETISRSAARTVELGRRLGSACQGGEVFLLEGELGAGKTCLAGGVAQGLGITQPAVSPTFVLLRSYAGARGLTLHHLDFYRLGGEDDLATIGLDDCFGEDRVIVVEWANRCPGAFKEWTLGLRLEVMNETTRRIRAYGGGLAVPAGCSEA